MKVFDVVASTHERDTFLGFHLMAYNKAEATRRTQKHGLHVVKVTQVQDGIIDFDYYWEAQV